MLILWWRGSATMCERSLLEHFDSGEDKDGSNENPSANLQGCFKHRNNCYG